MRRNEPQVAAGPAGRIALGVGASVILASLAFHAVLLSHHDAGRRMADWADSIVFGGLAAAACFAGLKLHRRAIARGEERFRLLVDGLEAIFWEGLPDPPRFTYVSAGAEKKLGYPVERWLGSFDFWASLLHPEDREATLSACARATAEGRDHALTYRMVAADGEVLWFEDLVRVEADPGGRPVRFSGVMVDISERVALQLQLERELRVSEGLAGLKRRLLRATSLAEIGEAALDHARALTESPHGFVAQVDPETGALVAQARTREVCEGVAAEELVIGESTGLMGWVRTHREPVVANDVPSDPRASAALPQGHLPMRRYLSVPALHGEELVGQIAVANAPRDYGPSDVKALQLLAPDVALAITRLRAQQALEASRGQLQSMVDSALDAIITVDGDGRVVVFNAAAERMFGVPAEEAFGKSLDRFVPARFREAHRSRVGAPGRTGGRTGLMTVYGLRADGSEFPIEASVSSMRAGRSVLSTAILRDIADRRKAEEEQMRLQRIVLQSSDDWRRTFDAMPSAVVVLDGAGVVQRLNRAAAGALGGGYGEFLGRPIALVAPHEPWRTAVHLAADAASSSRTRVRDETSGRWWNLTVSRIADWGSGEPRTIVAADDVTALVNLESSVGRAEKMAAMGALTAGVAHEVRNPLFAIAASVDALGAVLAGRTDVTHLLELMREQVARMNQLMHELLVYGRPVAADSFVDEALEPVVERSLRACRPLAAASGVRIETRGDLGRHPLRADASRLEEVFTNLVENAVQHSSRDGVVTLAVEESANGGRVRVRVEDQGPGFRPEDLPRLFEPFFTRRAGGTGLGLSIVQRIVEQHGGSVTAANRPAGGASVCVELPLALDAAVESPLRPSLPS